MKIKTYFVQLGGSIRVIKDVLRESWLKFILLTSGFFLFYNAFMILGGVLYWSADMPFIVQPSGVKFFFPPYRPSTYNAVIFFLGVGPSGNPIPIAWVNVNSLIAMIVSSVLLSTLTLLVLRRRQLKYCVIGSAGGVGGWLSSLIALGTMGCPVCGWAPALIITALGFGSAVGTLVGNYAFWILPLSILLQIVFVLFQASVVSAAMSSSKAQTRP